MERRKILLLLPALALAACDGMGEPAGVRPPAVGDGASPVEYRLGPGDKLRIVVFNEEQLTGEYTVDPNGEIAMPLIGAIRISGQTTAQLVAEIVARFRRANLLRDPNVTVQVLETRPFYVLGEVQRPGEFRFRPGLSPAAAVAMAGGFTMRANQRRVYVARTGTQGEMRVELADSFAIEPGDVVRVIERFF